MKKIINIILLVILGVSLCGCEWFEHDCGMKPSNNSTPYDTAATELFTHGGSGKLYSNDILIFKGNVLEVVNTSSTMDLDFKIIVKDLDFNPNNDKNIIKIKVGKDTIDFSLWEGKCVSSRGEFEYENIKYGIEDIKQFGDSIYIAFVNYSDSHNNATFDNSSYYDPILSHKEIEDSIEQVKYELTYIDFGNGLSKQCYIINHKIYTKSMLGDRWIYLAEMQSPIGYITTTTVRYMIGSVKIDYETNNGFADKNKVYYIIERGYKKYGIESEIKKETIIL